MFQKVQTRLFSWPGNNLRNLRKLSEYCWVVSSVTYVIHTVNFCYDFQRCCHQKSFPVAGESSFVKAINGNPLLEWALPIGQHERPSHFSTVKILSFC